MQRFATGRFDHHRGAKLEAGGEVPGYRIGLDHVHHVFLERPTLERMSRGPRAELRRFAGEHSRAQRIEVSGNVAGAPRGPRICGGDARSVNNTASGRSGNTNTDH